MRKFILDPAADPQDQVRDLLEQECTAARRALRTANAVHAIRRHGKRSRALLRLIRPGLRKKHFKSLNRAWRDIGRLLAPARDRAVIADCLAGLSAHRLDEATSKRAVVLRRNLPRIDRARMQATLHQVQVALDGLPPCLRRVVCTGGWPTIIAGHAQALAACQEAGQRARGHHGAARRHEWRKRVKDVRYQTHLLRRFSPAVLRRLEKAWDRLGDHLGAENDLVTTHRWIVGLPGAAQETTVAEAVRRALQRLRRRSDRAAGRLPTTTDAGALLAPARAQRA